MVDALVYDFDVAGEAPEEIAFELLLEILYFCAEESEVVFLVGFFLPRVAAISQQFHYQIPVLVGLFVHHFLEILQDGLLYALHAHGRNHVPGLIDFAQHSLLLFAEFLYEYAVAVSGSEQQVAAECFFARLDSDHARFGLS